MGLARPVPQPTHRPSHPYVSTIRTRTAARARAALHSPRVPQPQRPPPPRMWRWCSSHRPGCPRTTGQGREAGLMDRMSITSRSVSSACPSQKVEPEKRLPLGLSSPHLPASRRSSWGGQLRWGGAHWTDGAPPAAGPWGSSHPLLCQQRTHPNHQEHCSQVPSDSPSPPPRPYSLSGEPPLQPSPRPDAPPAAPTVGFHGRSVYLAPCRTGDKLSMPVSFRLALTQTPDTPGGHKLGISPTLS